MFYYFISMCARFDLVKPMTTFSNKQFEDHALVRLEYGRGDLVSVHM
jgi:hypothetical protein